MDSKRVVSEESLLSSFQVGVGKMSTHEKLKAHMKILYFQRVHPNSWMIIGDMQNCISVLLSPLLLVYILQWQGDPSSLNVK